MENNIPAKIDMISGFFTSLLATSFNAVRSLVCPNLYNSRVKIEIDTLKIEIETVARVATDSPSSGKAKVMKGMPKKAKLPKIVLKMSR
jgi:hypothetical protein